MDRPIVDKAQNYRNETCLYNSLLSSLATGILFSSLSIFHHTPEGIRTMKDYINRYVLFLIIFVIRVYKNANITNIATSFNYTFSGWITQKEVLRTGHVDEANLTN